jgi:exopolysaccharide biosynthesis protein
MKIRFGPWIAAVLITCGCSRADTPPEHPYAGITYHQEARKDPAQRLYWANIDLSDPHVSLHVAPGGPDPDGDGKWQTTLMPPSQIAQREGFELTVNGDFFTVKKDEGKTPAPGYKAEQWATVIGPAATDGKTWATTPKPRPCLVVKKSGKVVIESLAKPGPDDAQVIAGNVLLVRDGKPIPHDNTQRHPRTVIGLDASSTHLILLVLDGRKQGVAEGMSYAELSKEMIAAGCQTALNLDGGGSSVMVLREGDKFTIKNHPSNESQRPVGNVLGIDVKDAK